MIIKVVVDKNNQQKSRYEPINRDSEIFILIAREIVIVIILILLQE